MSERPGLIRRFFGAIWRTIDFLRRFTLNAIFLLVVIVLAFVWLESGKPPVLAGDTALVLNLQGDIVEEYTISSQEAALAELLGEERFETRLRDIVAGLNAAAKDARITRVILVLDQMGTAGAATLREIVAALDRVRAAGKPIIAWSESYGQAEYYLAANADQVFLHPAGNVLIKGFGGRRMYFRDLLDKAGVTVNAFQAGRYKSFGEPFTRTGPTPESQEADAYLLNDLWGSWLADVERARKLKAGSIMAAINDLPQRLTAVDGDIAQLVVKEGLVDGLKRRDEFRALMFEQGAPRSSEDKSTFRQISIYAYQRHIPDVSDRDAVGIVVVQGEIIDGDGRAGRVGSRTTAALIQRAREDEDIKALVVRVDSPGGSAVASELIREQLVLTRSAGKPVVVSMGDVAASGGYWIAMGGDKVIADAATITGSIGVFGLVPTFSGTLDKVGIKTDGVATTWIADAVSLTRPLDKRLGQVVELSIGNVYRQFLDVVAENRKSTPEKINTVAQGRVWSGAQAKERGLIDELGGLELAVKTAAERANLGSYRIEYVEQAPRGLDRYLSLFFGRAAAYLKTELGLTVFDAWPGAGQRVRRELGFIAAAHKQPAAALSYCFCDLR